MCEFAYICHAAAIIRAHTCMYVCNIYTYMYLYIHMYIYIDRERDIASITVACVASDTGVSLFPRCI